MMHLTRQLRDRARAHLRRRAAEACVQALGWGALVVSVAIGAGRKDAAVFGAVLVISGVLIALNRERWAPDALARALDGADPDLICAGLAVEQGTAQGALGPLVVRQACTQAPTRLPHIGRPIRLPRSALGAGALAIAIGLLRPGPPLVSAPALASAAPTASRSAGSRSGPRGVSAGGAGGHARGSTLGVGQGAQDVGPVGAAPTRSMPSEAGSTATAQPRRPGAPASAPPPRTRPRQPDGELRPQEPTRGKGDPHGVGPALGKEAEGIALGDLGTGEPGTGGSNDAAGTDSTPFAGGDLPALALAQRWIESRWADSPEGLLQVIEEGEQAPGRDADWHTITAQYAAVAEAETRRERIPPPRRAFVQAYFSALRADAIAQRAP